MTHDSNRPRRSRSAFRRTPVAAALSWSSAAAALVVAAAAGCSRFGGSRPLADEAATLAYHQAATEIEYPNVHTQPSVEAIASLPPRTLGDETPPEYWSVTLEEAVRTALMNSPVLRDLGGQVLVAPNASRTIYNPSLVETDPRFGVEAALAAFDTDFSTSAFFEKNDRALNNIFFGGGTRLFDQDYDVYQMQFAKTSATGTRLFLRHHTDYDANNAPGNLFGSAWNTNFETEVRQPLLQGAGILYNRIAGPDSIPGLPRGVLIARVDEDISLADFEMGVRNLVSDVENAYWDLYFGYRDLDSKIAARDSALETWRRINALYATGRRGGEAEKEAQARDQYFQFQAEVENSLAGRPLDGTRTNNGSVGGTFRGQGGVLVGERRLRLAMGLPASDGRLIRPADEPVTAKVLFNWDEAAPEALARRAELRRQRWQIKRAELSLIAARNFLKPTLDAVGRYRWRGFGKDLIDPSGSPDRFGNAYENLLDGDFQEWQLGVELDVPIGFRVGHAAVRNAELQLMRERAILHEQELEIIHDLSDAMAEVDRAYTVSQTYYNRRVAAKQQVAAVQAAYDADAAPLHLLLDSQRRLAASEAEYYRSLVEYSVALKNVHFEMGTLLDYNNVYLSEGPWKSQAYKDAWQRDKLRTRPLITNYCFGRPPLVSEGPYPQELGHGPQQSLPRQIEQVPPPHMQEPSRGNGELPGPMLSPGASQPGAHPVLPAAYRAELPSAAGGGAAAGWSGGDRGLPLSRPGAPPSIVHPASVQPIAGAGAGGLMPASPPGPSAVIRLPPTSANVPAPVPPPDAVYGPW